MRARWPSVPRTLLLAGGPVRVRQVADPRIIDSRGRTRRRQACDGYYDSGQRAIVLASGLTQEQKWKVLAHEFGHAALEDTGASEGLTMRQEEQVCHALALALLHQMRFLTGREV